MKKNLLLLSISLTLLVACRPDQDNSGILKYHQVKIDEEDEPPLMFKISIGDSISYVLENEAENVKGNFIDPKVNITVHEWRYFSHGNIRFDYPRAYTFEADIDMLSKIWTLSGNDFNIMYLKLSSGISIEEYIQELKTQFGESNCSSTPLNKKFKNLELKGIKLEVTMAKRKLNMEIFKLPSGSNKSEFLVFQDSPENIDEYSEDAKTALDRLSKTIRIIE